MRLVLALVLIAGCSSRSPASSISSRASPPAKPEVRSAELPVTVEMLRAFADDHSEAFKLFELIPEEATRAAIVKQVLREGTLGCEVVNPGCPVLFYGPPEPDETITSPCFRRTLVELLLASFRPDSELELDRGLLRTLMSYDEGLIRIVAMRLSEAQQIELVHSLAKAGAESRYILNPLSTEGAAVAVGRYHLDEGVDSLDRGHHEALLRRVVFDRTFSDEARSRAIMELADSPGWGGSELVATLRPLLADRSCRVAAAATSIVSRSDPSVLPFRPRTRDPQAVMRALCLFALGSWGAADVIAASFAPSSGIEVIYPDGRAYAPSRARIVETSVPGNRVPRNGVVHRHVDELEEALRSVGSGTCTGTVCKVFHERIEVELQPDAAGDLVIVRLHHPRDFAEEAIPDSCSGP